MNFLYLPFEIRIQIYREIFGQGHARIDAGRQDTGIEAKKPSLLPSTAPVSYRDRSAQILRTCKIILFEAQPVLYGSTIFRTSLGAFAGRLPTHLSNGSPVQKHAQHIEWSLSCDILKRFDQEDIDISEDDVQQLQTLELSCLADNWTDSYSGDFAERQVFVSGRKQVIELGKLLQVKMRSSGNVILAEDTRQLSRGRVSVKLCRRQRDLHPDDFVLA